MRDIFTAAKREHWADAFGWLLFTLILGALPFWGIALVLWIFAQPVDFQILTRNAELAVYSAGLLSSAIPLMQREARDSPFKQPKWFLVLSILVIIAAALIFASVGLIDRFPSALARLNPSGDRVLKISLALVTISLALAFFAELANSIRINPDVRAIRESQISSLTDEVRAHIQRPEEECVT